MTKEKPITPYERLMNTAKEFARAVEWPHRKVMWTYPKKEIEQGCGYAMKELHARVSAADQLGYDVRLRVVEEGLRIEYVKRATVPLGWL